VVNTSMELGGNAPFIIFEDADIDAAVEGALIAKMRNGGEACTAANRFYVHEAVADEFSRTFAARLDAMKVGPGLDEGTDVGPLVNEPTRSKVAELVESARPTAARWSPAGGHPTGRVLLPADRHRPGAVGRRDPRHRDLRTGGAPWSGSPPRTTPSAGPTTPSSGWSPTSTPAT
jgi:NAD-dependent aldehyde dehydrogenases